MPGGSWGDLKVLSPLHWTLSIQNGRTQLPLPQSLEPWLRGNKEDIIQRLWISLIFKFLKELISFAKEFDLKKLKPKSTLKINGPCGERLLGGYWGYWEYWLNCHLPAWQKRTEEGGGWETPVGSFLLIPSHQNLWFQKLSFKGDQNWIDVSLEHLFLGHWGK